MRLRQYLAASAYTSHDCIPEAEIAQQDLRKSTSQSGTARTVWSPVADRYLRGTARARRGPSTEPEMRSCSGGSGRLAESGHARRVFERPAESRHARAANQVMRARRGRP